MRNARIIGRVLKDEWHHRPLPRIDQKNTIRLSSLLLKARLREKPYSLRWNCSYFHASKTWSFTWPSFESDGFLETENHDHVILFHRAFPSQRKFLNGYEPFKLVLRFPLQDNTMLVWNYNHILLSPFILKNNASAGEKFRQLIREITTRDH